MIYLEEKCTAELYDEYIFNLLLIEESRNAFGASKTDAQRNSALNMLARGRTHMHHWYAKAREAYALPKGAQLDVDSHHFFVGDKN